MWGAFSDERTALSFTIAAGPRQGNHSRVRDPWDSRPYFTLSDSKLPCSSSHTTRRATTEVFDLDTTRDSGQTELVYDWRLLPNSWSWRRTPWDSRPEFLFLNWTPVVIVLIKYPLGREDGSTIYKCFWLSPAHSFSDTSPVGPATIFYSPRFETSLLSPPTTHRVRVEVFDPASTQGSVHATLFYDWRFTANQFVFASSPFRPTTTDIFPPTEPLWY
jgi:hypothetical protein